jgi:hypothetical protein
MSTPVGAATPNVKALIYIDGWLSQFDGVWFPYESNYCARTNASKAQLKRTITMKMRPYTMKALSPTPAQTPTPIAANDAARSVMELRPVAATRYLMPYEAAAKAIFVKANGLTAYHKATGTAYFTCSFANCGGATDAGAVNDSTGMP